MAKKRLTKAERIERERWLEHYHEAFAQCRDLGHNMRTERKWGQPAFYRRKVTCSRCGYSYEQNIRNGAVIWKGHQQYPTDYIKPSGAGKGRIARDVFRTFADESLPFDSDEPPGLDDLLKQRK